jgi:hypothetical protein
LQAGLVDEFEQLTKDGLQGLTSSIISSPSIKNIGPDGKLDIPDGIISENIDALFKADPEGKLNSAGQAIQGYLLEAIIGTLSNLTPESSGSNFDFKNISDAGGLEGLADLYGPDGANILAALSAFDAKARNKALEDSIAGKVGSFLANDVTDDATSSQFAQIQTLFADGGQVPVAISNKEGLIDPETANKNLPLLERARQGFGSAISEIAKKNIKIGEVSGPGTGISDSIKTTLASGTFVLPKSTMDSLKSQRFASGGRVGFPGGGRVGGAAKGLEVADLIQDFVALSFVVNGVVSAFSGGFDIASLINTLGIVAFSLDSFTGVLDRGKKVFESAAKAQAKSAATIKNTSKAQKEATDNFRKATNNLAAERFSGKAGRGGQILLPFGPSPEERRKRRGRDRQRLSREDFRKERIKGVRSRLKERRARLRSGQTPAQFRSTQKALPKLANKNLALRFRTLFSTAKAGFGLKGFLKGRGKDALTLSGLGNVLKGGQKGLAPAGGTTVAGAISRGAKGGLTAAIASLLLGPIEDATRKGFGETQRGDARGFEENGRFKSAAISGGFDAASGALLGASIGSLTGPFAPVLVPLFAALGGLTGAITGVIDGLNEQAAFDLFKSLEKPTEFLSSALEELGDDFRDTKKLARATKAQEKFFKSTVSAIKGFEELNNGLRTSSEKLIANASSDNPAALFNPFRGTEAIFRDLSESAANLEDKFNEAGEAGNNLAGAATLSAKLIRGAADGTEAALNAFNDAVENNFIVKGASRFLSTVLGNIIKVFADFSDAAKGGQGFFSNLRARVIGPRLGPIDDLIGLFQGKSGQQVGDERALRDQAFINQGQAFKNQEAFRRVNLILPKDQLKKSQEQFQNLGVEALSELSVQQLEALGDVDDIGLDELGDRIRAVGGSTIETSKSFRAFQKSAALLAASDLDDTIQKILDQDSRQVGFFSDGEQAVNANLNASVNALSQGFINGLNEGKGAEQAARSASLAFQERLQDGLRTAGGSFNDKTINDLIGNFDPTSIESFLEAIEKVDGTSQEGAAKLTALARASGFDNTAQLTQALSQYQQTVSENTKGVLAAAKAQFELQKSLSELAQEFDAVGEALNQITGRTANAVNDLGIAFSNIDNKISQVLSTEQKISPIQRVNPFTNLAGRSDREIETAVKRAALATGQTGGEFEGIAGIAQFQRDASEIFKRSLDSLTSQRGGNVSAANISEQEFIDEFKTQAGAAFANLPEGIQKGIETNLRKSFGGSRQGGEQGASIDAIKNALGGEGEGNIESVIGAGAGNIVEQLASITEALNKFESQILESANIQADIIRIRGAAEEQAVARRQELESRLSRFIVQNVDQRQLAEKNLRQRLETIASAGGQIGIGGTDVLNGQQLLDRRSQLESELQDLLARANQDNAGSTGGNQGFEDAINDAIANGNDDLANQLANTSQALEGTKRAIEELSGDVTRLEAVEGELARIQEARLTQRQRAALFASRLGSAKDEKGRADVLNELLKGVNAAGKLNAGQKIGFDEAAAILQDPQTVFDALDISNDKVAQEQLLAAVVDGVRGNAAGGTGVAGELSKNQFLRVSQGTAQTLSDRLLALGGTVQGTTGAEQQGIAELQALAQAQIDLVKGSAEQNAKDIEALFEILREEIDETRLKLLDAGDAFAFFRGLLQREIDTNRAREDFNKSGVPNSNLSLGRDNPFAPDSPRKSGGGNLSLGRTFSDQILQQGRSSSEAVGKNTQFLGDNTDAIDNLTRAIIRIPIGSGDQSARGQVVPIGPLSGPGGAPLAGGTFAIPESLELGTKKVDTPPPVPPPKPETKPQAKPPEPAPEPKSEDVRSEAQKRFDEVARKNELAKRRAEARKSKPATPPVSSPVERTTISTPEERKARVQERIKAAREARGLPAVAPRDETSSAEKLAEFKRRNKDSGLFQSSEFSKQRSRKRSQEILNDPVQRANLDFLVARERRERDAIRGTGEFEGQELFSEVAGGSPLTRGFNERSRVVGQRTRRSDQLFREEVFRKLDFERALERGRPRNLFDPNAALDFLQGDPEFNTTEGLAKRYGIGENVAGTRFGRNKSFFTRLFTGNADSAIGELFQTGGSDQSVFPITDVEKIRNVQKNERIKDRNDIEDDPERARLARLYAQGGLGKLEAIANGYFGPIGKATGGNISGNDKGSGGVFNVNDGLELGGKKLDDSPKVPNPAPLASVDKDDEDRGKIIDFIKTKRRRKDRQNFFADLENETGFTKEDIQRLFPDEASGRNISFPNAPSDPNLFAGVQRGNASDVAVLDTGSFDSEVEDLEIERERRKKKATPKITGGLFNVNDRLELGGKKVDGSPSGLRTSREVILNDLPLESSQGRGRQVVAIGPLSGPGGAPLAGGTNTDPFDFPSALEQNRSQILGETATVDKSTSSSSAEQAELDRLERKRKRDQFNSREARQARIQAGRDRRDAAANNPVKKQFDADVESDRLERKRKRDEFNSPEARKARIEANRARRDAGARPVRRQATRPVVTTGTDPQAPITPLANLNNRQQQDRQGLSEEQREEINRRRSAGGQVVNIGPLGGDAQRSTREQQKSNQQSKEAAASVTSATIQLGEQIDKFATALSTATLGTELNAAADKLSALPSLQLSLNTSVQPVEVILNGGALVQALGDNVKSAVLAEVSAEFTRRFGPAGDVSDPSLA